MVVKTSSMETEIRLLKHKTAAVKSFGTCLHSTKLLMSNFAMTKEQKKCSTVDAFKNYFHVLHSRQLTVVK